ncbi:MAG: hypothetical protein AB7G39_11815 [Alphaproteobacteria bacterium]
MGGIVSTNDGEGSALDEARATVAGGLRRADAVAKGILGPAYEPVSAVAQALNPMDGIEALKRGGRAMLEGRPLDATIDTIMGVAGLLPTAAAVAKTSTALARSALRNAPEAVASKSAWIYNPPAKSPRPFEADYPAGARTDDAGRLTHDIDGRPLEVGGRIVGRRVAGGADEALPTAEFDTIAKEGTGRSTEIVPPRKIGGDAGRVVTDRDRRSGNIVDQQVYLSDKLTPEDLPKVYGHEIGHVIDQLAGEIPAVGDRTRIGMQLRQVYHDLNDGSWRRGMETPQRLQTRPEDRGYRSKDIPRELWAEAIRAYMADPNYLKAVAPDVAAAIRKAVNSNPSIRKIVQFNSGGIAGGVSLGTIGHDDRDR